MTCHHLRGGVDLKIWVATMIQRKQSHHRRGGVDLKDIVTSALMTADVTTFVVVWI